MFILINQLVTMLNMTEYTCIYSTLEAIEPPARTRRPCRNIATHRRKLISDFCQKNPHLDGEDDEKH